MEKFLSVYLIIFALMLTATVFLAMSSNGSLSQKWAKVRIRVDERRHKGLHEQPEDEFEPGLTPGWLFLAIIFLLICMLLSKV